ncbi:M4 family metallopeptidase [Massilia sp. MB5]|uniref:M4 family metallopeptidase n=1 Tax=unclassified Massilia TaxID=2609279 RepID=UPI00067D40EE|nr:MULTISPECIES: M4 family metallopeptidase [unclassified Massilia]AKU23846.1 bacillolysin family protein [Massilia sp. NR 4-1]UMR31205.1 M4 family metallopeptidase [Massilia sp. MB5]
MNLRKTLLAASIATLPMVLSAAVHAAPQSAPVMAAPVSAQSPQQVDALFSKLAARRGKTGLDADHGYKVTVQHPGVTGTRITRANHTYKGLRVFGSETVIVSSDAGEILSESASHLRDKLNAGKDSKSGFNTTPALNATAAIDKVTKELAAGGLHHVPPSAELLIYPVVKTVRTAGAANKQEGALNALDVEDVVDRYELAYLIQVRMLQGQNPVYYDYIVSAKNGVVLKKWKALQTVAGTGNSQYNGSVPLNTTQSGSTFSLKDPSRGTGGTYGSMAITNANHGTSPGSVYTNTTNTWGDGQQYNGGSTTNANGQTAAVNAMWGLMNTYDMHKNVLGWQSLDGQNTATFIAAHVNTSYDNAYYDSGCKCMYIGDGGSMFNNLGSIDVIGHEMGHGITDATSGLIYSQESGGLNESSSDIAGESTEAYARGGGTGTTIPSGLNDWQMGKEIAKNGQPLRWMWKPSKDGRSPDAWSTSIKNLDVHYSSGPNNRMFYFLSQGSESSSGSEKYSSYLNKQPLAMTGIGIDKAYRIWFKANSTKFTQSTNYADARNKVLQSAEELYGVGSKEAIAVKRAYAAINVGADVDENPGPGTGVSITTQPASITVSAGGTASFTVGASGGTSPYSYKWYRNGNLVAGATSATYSFTAQAADNGAVFNATVTDAANPPSTATSNNATLTVGSGGGGTERVTNGGFENGTTGWSGTTGVIGAHQGQSPYEGTRFAWLGGNGSTATETLTQDINIPATSTSATLSFALHIDTAETDNVVYDKLVVSVKNSAGTTLGTLATYSNLNPAAGFQIRTFNLLPYKGQTVRLSFSMTEDQSLQTSFVVDKVSVIAN